MAKYLPSEEGITHINIYSKSKLDLGRLLSNFAPTTFVLEDNIFQSVEAYYYWLATGKKHSHLKTLWGIEAKNEGKKLERVEVENFQGLVLEAIRCKLRQNRYILKKLTESTLPLTHYYYWGTIDNPKIKQLPQFQYIVDELERIRKLMKKHEKN